MEFQRHGDSWKDDPEIHKDNDEFNEELYNIDQMRTFYLKEWEAMNDWNDSPKKAKKISLKKGKLEEQRRLREEERQEKNTTIIRTITPKKRSSSLPMISSTSIPANYIPLIGLTKETKNSSHKSLFQPFKENQILASKLFYEQKDGLYDSRTLMRNNHRVQQRLSNQINEEIRKIQKLQEFKNKQSNKMELSCHVRSLVAKRSVQKQLEGIQIQTKRIFNNMHPQSKDEISHSTNLVSPSINKTPPKREFNLKNILNDNSKSQVHIKYIMEQYFHKNRNMKGNIEQFNGDKKDYGSHKSVQMLHNPHSSGPITPTHISQKNQKQIRSNSYKPHQLKKKSSLTKILRKYDTTVQRKEKAQLTKIVQKDALLQKRKFTLHSSFQNYIALQQAKQSNFRLHDQNNKNGEAFRLEEKGK